MARFNWPGGSRGAPAQQGELSVMAWEFQVGSNMENKLYITREVRTTGCAGKEQRQFSL
jgi:hypothetical protein